MQAVSVSQLRSNMKKYLDDVSKSSDGLIITRVTEEEDVIILFMKECNALNETNYLLSSAKNKERLHDSIDQLDNKNTSA